jgi:beta-lactam-binding protein with PASTA domain
LIFFLLLGDSIQNAVDKNKQAGEVVANKPNEGTKLSPDATQEIAVKPG